MQVPALSGQEDGVVIRYLWSFWTPKKGARKAKVLNTLSYLTATVSELDHRFEWVSAVRGRRTDRGGIYIPLCPPTVAPLHYESNPHDLSSTLTTSLRFLIRSSVRPMVSGLLPNRSAIRSVTEVSSH